MSLSGLILLLFFIGVAVYNIIPDCLLHRLGFGSWKRHYSPGVSITFDDGPDPEITPQVLKILAKYRITATFFVVGRRAVQYPDLIRRITAAGHQLGAHSQQHRFAWFMSPTATWRDWEENIAALEGLTGQSIEWIRPPWGTFNLATWWWMKKRKRRAVLWDVDGKDWLSRNTPEGIAGRVLTKAGEGSTVVLHDGGPRRDAKLNTLKALEVICGRLTGEKKTALVPLDFPDWSLRQRAVFCLWEKWESLFARLYRIEQIDAYNLFRLSRKRYNGPELHAGDGILAKKGDLVAEIHVNSRRILTKGTGDMVLGLKALKQFQESMSGLAGYVSVDPRYQDIKVLCGLTLLSRGVKGLGFNVVTRPITPAIRFIGMMQRMIMRIHHPAGKNRLNKRLGYPKLVWISRDELLKRHLKTGL